MSDLLGWEEPTDVVSPYCPFPKYKHRLWEEVVDEDRGYVEWLVSGDGPDDMSDNLYDYLMDLLERV